MFLKSEVRFGRYVRLLCGGSVLLGAGLAVGLDGHTDQALTSAMAMPVVEVVEAPLLVQEASLKSGQSLSQLLDGTDLSPGSRKRLIEEITEYRSPRALRPGFLVRWVRGAGGGKLQEITVPLNADSVVVIEVDDSIWSPRVDEVDVVARTEVVEGVIETSLYAAMVGSMGSSEIPVDERRALVDILAESVFAWQIDFSRDLQVGDRFWVVYDRDVRPDGSSRSSVIQAVQFEAGGRLHEAYRYTGASGAAAYYDRNGESLRRMFLSAPLEFRRISSAYSTGRMHPVLGVRRPHNGIDYAAASGTPVRATANGRVASAGVSGGYGNMVEIRHDRGFTTRYAHLSRFAQGVRAGGNVQQGQIIGYVGMTGLATGPHLHYEMHLNGAPQDPSRGQSSSGEPIPRGDLDAFRAVANPLAARIDALKPEGAYAMGNPSP